MAGSKVSRYTGSRASSLLIGLATTLQKHLGGVADYNDLVLVDNFIQECDDSALVVPLAFSLNALSHAYRVSNKDWLDEPEPIEAIERDHGVVCLAHSYGQTGRDRENERPVSNALTERAARSELLVRMDFVPVSR